MDRSKYSLNLKPRPLNILFMCVANSARSQMAEAIGRSVFGPHARIESAGSRPTVVNLFALEALKNLGFTHEQSFSKSFESLPKDFTDHLDFLITLCQEEVCPVILDDRIRKLHWPVEDPASASGDECEKLKKFIQTAELLKARIEEFKMQFSEDK